MKKTNLSWVGALLVFALLLWCTAATPGKIDDPSTYTCAVYSSALSLQPPVVAIELDDRLPPILAETLAEFRNVTIVPGDAMELDLAALIREHFAGMPVVVCANLPYYITSPIIMRLLEQPQPIRALTEMVQ